MALALPLLAGVGVSALLGGSVRRLAEVRFRAAWLFFAAVALQVVAFPFAPLPWHTPGPAASALWIGSYGLLLAAAALNRRTPGVPVVLAGLVCNLAAVLANGGHMPVRPQALRQAGYHYLVHQNSVVLARPRLPWLIDRWAAPTWVPGANVFSVGDVIIATGALVFALVATRAGERLLRGYHAARAGERRPARSAARGDQGPARLGP